MVRQVKVREITAREGISRNGVSLRAAYRCGGQCRRGLGQLVSAHTQNVPKIRFLTIRVGVLGRVAVDETSLEQRQSCVVERHFSRRAVAPGEIVIDLVANAPLGVSENDGILHIIGLCHICERKAEHLVLLINEFPFARAVRTFDHLRHNAVGSRF